MTEREREARADLIRQLRAGGVTDEQIERAIAEDRLAALPVELVLTRKLRYTVREMLAETGLPESFARRNYRSLGLPVPDFDERAVSDEDMESWRALKAVLDAGVPEDAVHEVGRLLGRGAAQIAEAIVEVFLRTYLQPGDTERDLGLRLGELAESLNPAIGPLTEGPVRLHLRERFRNEAICAAERATGRPVGTRPVAVAFADLVGFTPLAASVSAAELAEITGRLELLAADVARAPVRLIKLIGDAAMLVAPEPAPLVDAVSELMERASGELPPLRAGLAAGEALNHGGDWYGAPVNLASRIAAVAGPGEILADDSVAAGLGWRPLGEKLLRGFDEPVRLHQLQRSASPTPIG
jgi:adenylate cyclase